MLTALFLLAWLAPTSPEWVEISQQHYRKPIHSHNFAKHSDYPRLNEDEQIRPNSYKQDGKDYQNHSITEYNWNLNAYRLPGNVKRVNTDDGVVVENNQESINVHRVTGSIKRVNADTIKTPINQEKNINSNNQRYGPLKNHDEEAIAAKIERVPNIGSVKRVQLTNTPVKSPSIRPVPTVPIRRKDAPKYGTPVGDSESDEFEIEPTIFKDENIELLAPSNEVRRIFSSTEVPATTDERREPGLYNIKVSNSDLSKNLNKHHPLPPKPDDIAGHERNKSDNEKPTKTQDIKEVPAINETQNSNLKPNEKIQTKHPQLKQFLKNTDDKESEFVTKIDEIKELGIEDISFEEVTISNDQVRLDQNIKPTTEPTQPVKSQTKKENGEYIKQQEIIKPTTEPTQPVKSQTKKENGEYIKQQEIIKPTTEPTQPVKSQTKKENGEYIKQQEIIKPTTEPTQPVKSQTKKENGEYIKQQEINVNTMENVMKLLKVVADTISKNTRKGVDSKMKYLHELKYTLLANIKSRIDATWPDDGAARRRSRSAARGHVEFPSSESALMTISFLTFAVFLIKLVLQVIHTYKGKAMMVAPLVVATAGRAYDSKLRTSN